MQFFWVGDSAVNREFNPALNKKEKGLFHPKPSQVRNTPVPIIFDQMFTKLFLSFSKFFFVQFYEKFD